MKCGILTFHFAHNYGACLQCYALKKYLESNAVQVGIINFVPDNVKDVYEINPFLKPIHPKYMLKRILAYPRRLKQYKIFSQFISREFKCTYSGNRTDYEKELLDYDILICGSDQIWNNDITGNITEYYFDMQLSKAKKVSYAASFGKSKLDDFQIQCIKRYLNQFEDISLRENDGMEDLQKNCSLIPSIVLDPVFLLDSIEWDAIANKSVTTPEKYILYYSLKDNDELVIKTEELSEKLGLKILSIHPTCKKQRIHSKQLYNVGPFEFLTLLKNASIISTNSFHATAFSIIFGKTYFHIKDSGKENRIEYLLNKVKAYKTINSYGLLDFSKLDRKILSLYIQESKNYLRNCLKK